MHSKHSSPNVNILTVPNTINSFHNQIFFEKSSVDELKTKTIFSGYVRHTIEYTEFENLLKNMELAICGGLTNGIYATLEEIHLFGDEIIKRFPNSKFIHTTSFARDIFDEDEQLYLIIQEHGRAHRNFNENYLQLKRKYFFPNMRVKTKKYVKNCEICKINKYERHPKKQIIGKAPIPKSVGEIIHIDIFHADNQLFLSCIDKYSKYAIFVNIPNKLNMTMYVETVLQMFPFCTHVMTDNVLMFL